MQRLIVGVLIGLGLGSAASVGARQQLEPCAHAWVKWGQAFGLGVSGAAAWSPRDAYESKRECEAAALAWNDHLGDAKKGIWDYCYPDTFDPRGKQ